MSRSTCSIASNILKISNPKKMLSSLAYELSQITRRFKDKNRVNVLVECKKDNIGKYVRYLEMILKPLR